MARRVSYQEENMNFRELLLSAVLVTPLLVACNSPHAAVVETAQDGEHSGLAEMRNLFVLPVDLPDEIRGEATSAERATWREEWPRDASVWLAEEIEAENAGEIDAVATSEEPGTDHFVDLDIVYLDVGDPGERALNLLRPREDGWSHVIAKARIINAETGEIVAELDLVHGSHYDWGQSFEGDMRGIGDDLGEWIADRR